MNKIALLIIAGAFTLVALIYYLFDGSIANRDQEGAKLVQINKRWDMPILLEEISGISWIDENYIACIEDEEAIIFIYNTSTSKIDKQIVFGEDGDYEGIAVVKDDAYVLRSDGTLFEVQNYRKDSINVNEYSIGLPPAYDFEGLAYDKRHSRLLLAIKDKAGDSSKPIYAFNLKTKQFEKEPALEIEFNDPVFKILNQEINHQIIFPSEVGVNPVNGEIYVLDGTNPKLLILNSNGKIKKLHVLREEQFGEPEGLTFDNAGNLFISNEGAGGLGNILQVDLDEKMEEK